MKIIDAKKGGYQTQIVVKFKNRLFSVNWNWNEIDSIVETDHNNVIKRHYTEEQFKELIGEENWDKIENKFVELKWQ